MDDANTLGTEKWARRRGHQWIRGGDWPEKVKAGNFEVSKVQIIDLDSIRE